MNRAFWKGKRVLLTGHTGFKGAWFALWLQRLGAEVTGYALEPPTDPSLFETAEVGRGMRSIEADVRDLDRLRGALDEHRPEVIFHMAAQSLVQRSYREPVETLSTNVMGTVNVLEALRQVPCASAVVIITSDKCYENREMFWGYREDEPMGGHDPYSASKGCAELVTSAYRRSYFPSADGGNDGPAVASARAGNVIGGGDWAADRLIPDVMKAFMAGRTVTIRRPGAIRPWQHVLEPLAGYLRLAEHLWEGGSRFAGSWNFGPHAEDAFEVSTVVERLSGLWGEGARWELDRSDQPHEANFLKLDSSRARALLGWAPKLRLGTSLEWIVEWYRAFGRNEDMRRTTSEAIKRYEAME